MREYGFSLTRILPDKDKIYDFVLIRESTAQWKPVFSHIICSDPLKTSKKINRVNYPHSCLKIKANSKYDKVLYINPLNILHYVKCRPIIWITILQTLWLFKLYSVSPSYITISWFELKGNALINSNLLMLIGSVKLFRSHR